jgi:3-carboxy-cis,cis-muconate cycloisomerase
MRSNIDATKGLVFAERAMMLLADKLGRDQAHRILEEASRVSVAEGRRLREVLAAMPEVTAHLSPEALRDMETPESYLGVAVELGQRAVTAAGSDPAGSKDKIKKE